MIVHRLPRGERDLVRRRAHQLGDAVEDPHPSARSQSQYVADLMRLFVSELNLVGVDLMWRHMEPVDHRRM